MKAKKSLYQTLFIFLLIISTIFLASFQTQNEHSKAASANWWKGNIHTHSYWSDGDHYPEFIAAWYKEHGYNFLAVTEHNRLQVGVKWLTIENDKKPEYAKKNKYAFKQYTDRFGEDWPVYKTKNKKTKVLLKPLGEYRHLFEEPQRFILIQGEEITHKKAHMNSINSHDVIKPQEGETRAEILHNNIKTVYDQQKQTKTEMLAQINHPNYNWALTAEDMMNLKDITFFEVYNGCPGTWDYGNEKHAGTEKVWDILLTKRLAELNLPIVYATATDDAHHYQKFNMERGNPGRGWVVVKSQFLTPESLIKAMKKGQFYSSSGVELKDVSFDGKTLKIQIKSESGVKYTTQFIGTLENYDPKSQPVTDANGKELRVTRKYSDTIGQVLAESNSPNPSYTLKGNEIYVRAKIISTKPTPNPQLKGELEMAWTQPVTPDNN